MALRKSKTPAPVGFLTEIEVEFERNVSDRLDLEIREADAAGNSEEVKKLRRTRKAFLADSEEHHEGYSEVLCRERA